MRSSLDEVLDAFIDLYARDSLERWRELFLPAFVAAATNADGSVSIWTLEQFYERQRGLFASGKPVSEVLFNVEKLSNAELACVRADYVWTDGEVKRPGRLGMLLIVENDRFRIQSLAFSYRG
jgi:hypothetical protein